jgi:hypothetical protein
MAISRENFIIHPGLLFPYESSWLVYVKILQWNGVRDFKRLMSFICPEIPRVQLTNNWWDADLLTLSRLETAMGVTRGALKYSFINGWFPLPKSCELVRAGYRSRPLIRHCPTCIKYGYHSVIFYFSHITHCPWHHQLLEVCQECTSVLSFDWGVTKGVYSAADNCEHLSIVLDVSPPLKPVNAFKDSIQNWCNIFSDWVGKSVDLIGHNACELLVNQKHNNNSQDKQAAIDYLVERLGQPGLLCRDPARMAALRIPRSRLAWEIPYHDMLCNPRMKTIRRQQPQVDLPRKVTTTKSIRRYIFRTYLRFHRKCLARLKAMPKGDWCKLNAEAVCPCVLAYLIVFSARSLASPYELLHLGAALKSTNKNLKQSSRSHTLLRCEFEVAAFRILENFHEVWNALRKVYEVDCKLLVFTNRYESVFLPVKMPGFYSSGRWSNHGGYWDYYCFMDNPMDILAGSISDCLVRRSQPLCVAIDEASTSAFLNNDNIQCVIYNPATTSANQCRH